MEYRTLGRTELRVSEIGLGALEIGRDWGIQIEGDFGRPDDAAAIKLVHAAIDAGINFIDTAPAYQLSEERIGRAIQGRRDSVILATKAGEHYSDERGFWHDYSREGIRASIEQSLRRLQIDTIDLLQIHSANPDVIERGETLQEMQRWQKSGHVRFLGMSGGPSDAAAAMQHGGYDTVQVPYNLLDREAEKEAFPLAREHNVGVIIMIPLAHGALTAKRHHLAPDDPQAARVERLAFLERPGQTLVEAGLRFVLANPVVSTVIAGTRKPENLRSNLEAANGHLSDEDVRRLEEVSL